MQSLQAGDWSPILEAWKATEAAKVLLARVAEREAQGIKVFPPAALRLRALELTPLSSVQVVILGQDPYHGVDAATNEVQAQGLAFSVARGLRCPPSLRNIFKELERDTGQRRDDSCLEDWARQGVMLLNTILTVEQGLPASHAGWGWETLTDAIIAEVVAYATERNHAVVFMLWGAHAYDRVLKVLQERRLRLDAVNAVLESNLMILRANHPSPLAALRPPLPFIGCGHFAKANAFLQKHGCGAVKWS